MLLFPIYGDDDKEDEACAFVLELLEEDEREDVDELLEELFELLLFVDVVLEMLELFITAIGPNSAIKNASSIIPVCGKPLFCWKSLILSTIMSL